MTRFTPYLFAHFAKSQLWHASTLLFVFFLTERCGIGPMATGWIMGLSLVVNGGADVMLGRRWRGVTSAAAANRLQAAFAPVSAVFFILSCATALLPPPLRLGWALVTILGFRITYPLIDVPQNVLVPLLARSPSEQRRLLAFRNVASQSANLCVSAAAAPLLILGGDDRLYLGWAAAVASLAWTAAVLLARIRMPDRAAVPPSDPPDRVTPSYRALAILLAVMVAAAATFRTLEPYYAAFAVRETHFLLYAALGALVAQPLWMLATRCLGAVATLVGIAGVLVGAAMLLLTPWRDSGAGAAMIALGYGVGTGALWLALWAGMVAHASRSDAIGRVSGFTGLSKTSQGIAAVLVGYVLQRAGYRQTMPDPWSPSSLAMVVALVALAGCCLSLATIAFFRSHRAGG